MRIISGKHKSLRINAPDGLPVRPTTDMAKESLFNILNNSYYFDEIKVLDLFAGIGSISYEFASRDCPDITSVDNHPGCIQFIEDTANKLNMSDAIKTRKADVFEFVEKCNDKFDVIFCDPPFAMENISDIPVKIMAKDMLTEDGILIVEHGPKTSLENFPYFHRERKYGNIKFSIFKK
mgnify:CR=1 FL=1